MDVFYNRSADAGATLQPDERITDQSFDPNQVRRFLVFRLAFIGDSIHFDAAGGQVAVVWNDNRNVVSPTVPPREVGRVPEAFAHEDPSGGRRWIDLGVVVDPELRYLRRGVAEASAEGALSLPLRS